MLPATSKTLVLVVEDHPALRRGLEKLVVSAGHAVQAAATIGEAMAMLDASCPTCVILDLNLSDGVGTIILERIRREGTPARVVVLSATNDGSLLEFVRSLSPDAVFQKPAHFDQLCEWLKTC